MWEVAGWPLAWPVHCWRLGSFLHVVSHLSAGWCRLIPVAEARGEKGEREEAKRSEMVQHHFCHVPLTKASHKAGWDPGMELLQSHTALRLEFKEAISWGNDAINLPQQHSHDSRLILKPCSFCLHRTLSINTYTASADPHILPQCLCPALAPFSTRWTKHHRLPTLTLDLSKNFGFCIRLENESLFKSTFFKDLLLNSFLAVLARGCMRAFSACREWELLLIAVHGLPIVMAFLLVEHGL